MSFQELGLIAPLLRAIADQHYTEPTPIQTKAIPLVLERRDVLAGAQTGTGKTAGFALPLLQLLDEDAPPKRRRGRRPVRALILSPTRELAAQIGESIETYGKYMPFSSLVVFGGVNINPQIKTLERGVDILVATPGRLLDLVGRSAVDLSLVKYLVLDEADRMLDMGFIHDIKKVLALLPSDRQNLLFSATFSKEIQRLADALLNSPELVEVARRNTESELVDQVVHPVDRVRKRELLSHLIKNENWGQALVFTRTKHGANRLTKQLGQDGIQAAAIHGNKSQSARTRALSDFKQGRVQVLVATDIAARGLDIEQLPHVVNYELPQVPEDYVHRIGRTGRAGQPGEAVSLVCVDEIGLLKQIERLLRHPVRERLVDGFAPDPSIAPEPIRLRSAGRRNSGQGGRRNNTQGGRGHSGRAHGRSDRRSPAVQSSSAGYRRTRSARPR